MKRIPVATVLVLVLLGSATRLVAQGPSVDSFLANLSARRTSDAAERDQFLQLGDTLNSAPAAEVERMLPSLIVHSRIGNEEKARVYATGFLLGIALRSDGADLLSSKSQEISRLVVDPDPVVQRGAFAVTCYLIARIGKNSQLYVSAMQAAIQKPETPQDVGWQMIYPLLRFGGGDPEILKSVLSFLRRDDLTPSTRSDMMHGLGDEPELPDEVTEYLVKRLDDPDPHVRAMALVSHADSTTAYHTVGKARVARIANNPEEIPRIRELAKDAMAGKTHLDPNYDLPPLILDPKTGTPIQPPVDQ